MFGFNLILVILAMYGCTIYGKKQRKSGPISKVVFIKHLGQCNGKDNLTVFLPEFQVVQKTKNHYVINGQVIINKPLPSDLKDYKGTLDILKCADLNFHLEHCQQFMNRIHIDNVCEFLNSDFSFYGIFFGNLKYRPRCPLKMGVINITDMPINTEMIKYMPSVTAQNFATTLIVRNSKNEIEICISMFISVRPTRG